MIILANSERVFLDGVLLERGFNRDYTIDYNQGQITFTNRVLITEFSRIRIDYEYSDQNYNRSILAGYHEQRSGQWELRAQVYREGDNRNRPLFGTLSNEDKERLSQAGDDPTRALTSGVDSAAYSLGEVRYEKRDTVHSGGIQSEIYVYSTDPGRAWYRVRFSQTGPNQGNYVLDRITANGRVYKWVAPVNGVPQGDHTPFVRLPMPNKRQMVSLAGAFKPNDHEEVFVETAFSGQDRNLFSTLDDGDNNGVAVKTGMRSSGRKLNFLKDYAWEAYTDVEYDDRNFQAIDRFRTIEFNRDWNFNPRVDTARAAEKIVNAGFSMRKDNDRFLSYGITYRNREDQVNGFQHRAELGQQFKKIRIRGDLFQMNSVVPDFKASWTRLNTGISLRQAKWVPGYQFSLDRNTQSFADRDTSAMSFIAHQFYIHQGADSKWEYDLRHTYREDDRPQNGVILPYSTSNTTRFTLARTLGNHRLQALFTYRLQELENNEQDEETISSRVEWQGNWLKNIIRTDVTYAVLNSQELRREYVYIRVPAGEGTHTWRDLNEDNVQDLNEFFIAVNPDERNYAKIFVPTDEFVTAFQNLFVAQARIQMPAEWREKGGLPALLSRLSNNTSWTADNKITSDNLADKLFAFARSVDEEEILAQRDIFRSTTFFNRSNALYGLEFTYLDAKQKQLLTSGFEGSENRSYSYVLRFNPEQAYNLKLRAAHGTRRSFSDFLTDRNYLVRTQRINPEAAWQPGVHHRFTLQYAFEKKDNKQEEVSPEYSRSNTFQFEYRFAKAASSALQAQFSLINIEFSGVENTPVGYELLNALRPGRNLTWSLVGQQKITKGLQLNLSYDGRSSEDQRAIHTGRIQVSALF